MSLKLEFAKLKSELDLESESKSEAEEKITAMQKRVSKLFGWHAKTSFHKLYGLLSKIAIEDLAIMFLWFSFRKYDHYLKNKS